MRARNNNKTLTKKKSTLKRNWIGEVKKALCKYENWFSLPSPPPVVYLFLCYGMRVLWLCMCVCVCVFVWSRSLNWQKRNYKIQGKKICISVEFWWKLNLNKESAVR